MNSSGSNRDDGAYDVYVVDDDPTVLDVLVSTLTAKGISVKGLSSGKDLLDLITRRSPRLVLLDIMMPLLNGYTIFSSIKSLAAAHGIRVYFISALPERNLAWYAKTNGAAGYITKPFTMADINAALSDAGISPGSH